MAKIMNINLQFIINDNTDEEQESLNQLRSDLRNNRVFKLIDQNQYPCIDDVDFLGYTISDLYGTFERKMTKDSGEELTLYHHINPYEDNLQH